jgi:hypothetical protein
MHYDYAKNRRASRLAAASALLSGFFLAATTGASLAMPSGVPTESLSNAQAVAKASYYAGACRLPHPCYRYDLKDWRYGDERDYFCFMIGDY